VRPPDHETAYGKAWKLPGEQTSPASYLIWAPGQSPFWSYYLLALIDLADYHGVDHAHKDTPDARWEFAAVALDPEYEPDPDNFRLRHLEPQNVRVQVPDHPQEKAEECLRALMEYVVAGGLAIEPPLSTETHWAAWREIIEATLEHPYHHHDEET
jgi:hypothetical protein